MGDVMLDLHDNRSVGLRHGVWVARIFRFMQCRRLALQGKLRRELIRVQVGGDDLGPDFV